MKSLFRPALILAATGGLTLFAIGQTVPPAPPVAAVAGANGPVPKIRFDTETYDTGKTIVGTPIKFSFIVTNEGDAKLEITGAKGSCGCTSTTYDREIAAHQTGKIGIQINATGRGPLPDKTVTVTSNDPNRPAATLHIKVFLWTPIELSSPQVTLNVMPEMKASPRQVVHIANNEDLPLTLFAPESDNGEITASLTTNVSGKDFDLTVSLASPVRQAPTVGVTTVSGNISMKTSSTNLPLLKVPVNALFNPEIFVGPDAIRLPAGPLSRPSQNWISIRDNTDKGLTLSDPAINAPGVDISVKIMVTNKSYSLVAIFPPGFAVSPASNIVATVKTDNPRYPFIHVPVIVSPTAPVPAAIPPRPMPQRTPAAMSLTRLTNGQVRTVAPQPVADAPSQP
jgi:hypothetical protein